MKETIHLDKSRINPPTNGKIPWEDFYQLYRQHIVDNHNILNQRTIWLAISQSFFFGGYATIVNAPKESKNSILSNQQDLLLWLIPIAALLGCICIFFGIIARSIHIQTLYKKFYSYGEMDDNYPSIDVSITVKRMEIFAVWVLPLVFIATWIFILVNTFIQI